MPDQMLDEDIGPGGAFVTRWAADSADAAGGRLSQLVPAGAFSVSDEDPASRISMASMPLPNVDPTAESVPAALLPAPPGPGAAPGGNGSEAPRGPDPQFMSVALLTSEPRFDVEAELWFVDLELRTEGMSDPYVRLGLVRYQPHARDDAAPAEGEEPVRLRVSTPVSVPARVLPGQTAEATWRKTAGGGTDVYVTARVSRPIGPGGATASGPATRITLMARRRDPGQHVGQMATAMGADTKPCLWESWTGAPNGAIAHSDGTTSFTCLFTLPGEVEDQKWEHVAMVEAFSRRPPATYSHEPIPAAGDETLVESGPDFLAMLELQPPGRAAATERGNR